MTIPTSPSGSGNAPARALAEQLFQAAARDEAGLTPAGKLHCLRAADALAVDSLVPDTLGATRVAAETASAGHLIRAGLHTLGDLDAEQFADPRVDAAAGHALRALRGVR